MATRQFAYQNHPIMYKLTILGQDVTQYLSNPESISSSLDYPEFRQFRLADATIRLKNPDNLFSPYNANNFFIQHGTSITPNIQADGYRAIVRLQAGYHVSGAEQLQDIYVGEVQSIRLNAKEPEVNIVCIDRSDRIRRQEITDFGLEKKMAVEASGDGLHGNYPFYEGVLPFSVESVTSPGLTRRQYLNTEGPLDSTNFQEQPESGILTEGGRRTGDPIIQFKAPYRNRKIEDLVPLLLNKYGIMASDVSLPIASTANYWSNLGRPYYEPAYSDLTVSSPGTFQWKGVVTQMLGDTTNDIIYMLISQTGHPISLTQTSTTPQPKPRIMRWNLRNDRRDELIEIRESGADVSEECWNMVADSTFNTFYVLGCQPDYVGPARDARGELLGIEGGFAFGSYSSFTPLTDNPSTIRVHQITNMQTSPSRRTYFDPQNSGISLLLPQLACYYNLGGTGTTPFALRQGELPDSRRGFHLRGNGDLIYPFATRTKFGVAKGTAQNTASEVISAMADKSYNASSFTFTVDEANSHVYFAFSHINKGANSSRAKIVRGNIT